MRKLITIALPAYNEEGNLPRLEERLGKALAGCTNRYDFEFLILDNGSTDRTFPIAQDICRRDARYRLVRYSRNFGCEASLCAALDLARGDAVFLLFSDLQDPPELIPTFIQHWEQGADVVYGQLNRRNDSSPLKSLLAPVGYWLIGMLSDCQVPRNATDFRLIDRRTVEVLKGFRENDRYLRGLVHWVGFKQIAVAYDRAPRTEGKSSANLIYCIRFALHAVVCFSGRPLELAMWVGLLLTVGSFFLSILYIILFFVRPSFMYPPPPGITTLILFQIFAIGINSFFLGVIGHYLARVYNQGKQRPIYIVDQDSLSRS
jgi:glycosyltransferase involved in cell wall biosynthesis